MKRFLCLILATLCLMCFLTPACASETEAEDYNTAGKLLKQLWAGSGFSGTLTLDITPAVGMAGRALGTTKQLALGVDYIYVRPTTARAAEHRLDLSLVENDATQASAHLSLSGGVLAAQTDLLNANWYALDAGEGVRAQSGEDAPTQATTDATDAASPLSALGGASASVDELMSQVGAPALIRYMLPLALRVQGETDTLESIIEAYAMRIDLWIEGYRQSAVLNKLEDGTTTMTAQYLIPPAAIKAQLKQMVLDALSDPATLTQLQSLVSAQDAAILLNPNLRSYYFQSIDDLPLPGDMTIERAVSLKGETLALHISLPMYDAEGGALDLRYDRVRGDGDLPDQNTITLEGARRVSSIAYQAYSSMEGVSVYQGTILSEATGTDGFAVAASDESADVPQKTIAAAFALTLKQTEGRDESERDFCNYDASLTLSPDETRAPSGDVLDVPETEITLSANFASKTLKTAATEMDATLTIGGAGQPSEYKLHLTGKSRKKWDPTPLPDTLVSLSELSGAELTALLPGLVTRGSMLLMGYFTFPTATEAPTSDGEATATPEIFETIAPGATIAP